MVRAEKVAGLVSLTGKVARHGRVIVLSAAALLMIGAGLILTKVWQPNRLWAQQYPVWGVDVSHYQGQIDWETMALQGVDFAFVKATEGSSTKDARFAQNFQGATDAGILTGAYHFFSFDSTPEAQVQNYRETVGPLDGHLPPVVDAEYYGPYFADPPPTEEVRENLRVLLDLLAKEYGTVPILYTTYPFYLRYLRGAFEESSFWIRNVYFPPFFGPNWIFWQYTDTARLYGYEGAEPNIDLNVFFGSEEELLALCLPQNTVSARQEGGGMG